MLVFEKIFLVNFHNQTPFHETSKKNKYVTNCSKLFCAGKQKEIFWIIKCASKFETVTD